MITQQFYDEIIFHLSGTLVDVELELEDVDKAFNYALQQYKQKGSDNHDRAFMPLQVEKNKNEYDVPPEVNTINQIIRSKATDGIYPNDPFSNAMVQDYFNHSTTFGGSYFMIYDLTMNIIENHRMYTAEEPNFRYLRSKNKLVLMNPPRTNQTWYIDVYVTLNDAAYEKILWVKDWTIAECKQILGRAYRKFGGNLPSPNGETQPDGNDLVQEAQQEKEALLEQISDFVDGEPDGMPIYIG